MKIDTENFDEFLKMTPAKAEVNVEEDEPDQPLEEVPQGKICTICGSLVKGYKVSTGRTSKNQLGCLVEFLGVLIVFCIPVVGVLLGIVALVLFIKSVNTRFKKTKKCPRCGGCNCLIPVNTPMGMKIYRDGL